MLLERPCAVLLLQKKLRGIAREKACAILLSKQNLRCNSLQKKLRCKQMTLMLDKVTPKPAFPL
jgi:hypothetical protein